MVDASGGRDGGRLACRSARAQEAVDDLDRLVFGLQFYRRFFAGILVPVSVPRPARHWYGGGMAGRRGAGDGAVADPFARFYGRGSAGVMGSRHGTVERGLRTALRCDRLARPVVDRDRKSTRLNSSHTCI